MSFCNRVQLIWKMTERETFGENIFPDWCLMAKKIESARWNGREADESNLISKHSICRVGGLVFWLKLRLICMLSPLDRHSSISLPETRTFKCMMWIHHLLLIVFLMIPLRAVATVEVQPSAYIREWQLCRTNSNKWNTRERYWISPHPKLSFSLNTQFLTHKFRCENWWFFHFHSRSHWLPHSLSRPHCK